MDADRTRQLALGLDRLAELLRAQAWKRQGESGLNPTQQAVLRQLDAQPNGLRLSQLAAALGVSAASLSDTVSALERRGDVVRRPDPDDGRASRIRLAAAGRRRRARLGRENSASATLVAALTSSQQGELLRLLLLLIRQAQDSGLASGFRTCLGCRFFQPCAHAGSEQPHHCGFVDRPFGHGDLRIDCAEQEAAEAAQVGAAAHRLCQTESP